MPLYQFICLKCKHEYEKMMRIAEREAEENTPCPECGEKTIKQNLKGCPAISSGGILPSRARRAPAGR